MLGSEQKTVLLVLEVYCSMAVAFNWGRTLVLSAGSEADPGIMPLALQSIFNKVRLQSEQRHNVRMSCFQLYREQAFDLLYSAQSKVAPSLTRSKTHHHILSGLTSLRMRWSKLVRNYIHRHEIPSPNCKAAW
jgi:hypothetical protein